MYNGRCPYCGKNFGDRDREVLKEKLKIHMKEVHYVRLLEGLKRTKYPFAESVGVEWYAGVKASFSIKEFGQE
jgi:hypothetical protein